MNPRQNSSIFIQERAFENEVCERASILSRPQWVNKEHYNCVRRLHTIYTVYQTYFLTVSVDSFHMILKMSDFCNLTFLLSAICTSTEWSVCHSYHFLSTEFLVLLIIHIYTYSLAHWPTRSLERAETTSMECKSTKYLYKEVIR